MSGMKIGKQIEIKTLNLKFLTEKLKIIEKELKDGTDDLHFRLSHFRKRVTDKAKFDQFFFGVEISNSQKNTKENATDVIPYKEKKELPTPYQKKDLWLKKVYRKIVSSTHPDKFNNFHVKHLKKKYLSIYRKTIEAWNNEENDQILLCAYELDIKVQNPKALPILQQGSKQKHTRIEKIKTLLAYQWYHIPVQERSKTLEVYLKELGYEFTSEKVKEVISLARKRKVGSRPKNLRKLKNVK